MHVKYEENDEHEDRDGEARNGEVARRSMLLLDVEILSVFELGSQEALTSERSNDIVLLRAGGRDRRN